MRFRLIPRCLLFAGLCACLTGGELWLRDGFTAQKSQIVFNSTRDGNSEIYVMDSDGGNQNRLTENQADDGKPAWSPDGHQIAFVSNRGDGRYKIYVMDADGKYPIRLTDGVWDTDPDWSPDGQKIAFTASPEGIGAHIAIMDADGKNLLQLINGQEPSWSPVGERLAFISRRDRHDEIYIIATDGTGLRRVTHDLAAKGGPSWSPDGQRVAYWSEHGEFFQIYVVDTDGKNRKRLTHNRAHNMWPAWSTDGKTIAYVSSKGIDVGVREQIHLMTAEGIYLKQLSDFHDGADYGPDFGPVELAVSPTSKTTTIWGRLKKISSSFRKFAPNSMESATSQGQLIKLTQVATLVR